MPTNAEKELAETVYYLYLFVKQQNELILRTALELSALTAAIAPSVPGLLTRFEAEHERLKNGPTAELVAEMTKQLDALIERLEQIYGPLKN